MHRHELSDVSWEKIKNVLPPRKGRADPLPMRAKCSMECCGSCVPVPLGATCRIVLALGKPCTNASIVGRAPACGIACWAVYKPPRKRRARSIGNYSASTVPWCGPAVRRQAPGKKTAAHRTARPRAGALPGRVFHQIPCDRRRQRIAAAGEPDSWPTP